MAFLSTWQGAAGVAFAAAEPMRFTVRARNPARCWAAGAVVVVLVGDKHKCII